MGGKTFGIVGVGVGVGALGLALGALTIASADDQTSPTPTASQQVQNGPGGPGSGETALTGTDAEKVTAAAQAAVPDGTIIRVETDADGVYEAHMQRADGTDVVVAVDANFQVTGTQEMRGRDHGGPGMGETPLTGTDADKATAAAEAEFPDGTVLRVETDADGTYEAHVQKADGTEAEVKMDKNFNITSVEEHGDLHGIDGDTSSADSAA